MLTRKRSIRTAKNSNISNSRHTGHPSLSPSFLLALALGCLLVAPAVFAASLSTDQAEYSLETQAGITGRNFEANESVQIVISFLDGTPLPSEVVSSWSVTADGTGGISPDGGTGVVGSSGDGLLGFVTDWTVSSVVSPGDTLLVTATGGTSGFTATALLKVAKDYSHQLQNGTNTTAPEWSGGAINANNSCYSESRSVPYRYFATELLTGTTHYFTITMDATNSTSHAIDYLTQYDLSEGTALLIEGPCDASSPSASPPGDCATPVSVGSLPDPRLLASYSATPPADVYGIINPSFPLDGPGDLYAYNATNVSLGGYYYTGSAGARSLNMVVTFDVVADGSVGFYFGGHLAQGHPSGWGIGNGSASISGAPFHMEPGDLDGNTAQPDLAIQNSVVCSPPDVTMTCSSGPYCSGSTQTCSIPSGAATYFWTLSGATIVSGQGTTSLTYLITAPAGSPVSIEVEACSANTGCPGDECCAVAIHNFTAVDCCTVTITCPSDLTLECDQSIDPSNTGTATYTTSGICPTPITISYFDTETAGACAQEKTISRLWKATDNNGTVRAQCTQTITLVDTTPPVLAGCPTDVTADCDAIPSAATVTASDNCDPAPSVTLAESTVAGSCAQAYTLVRTWTATDACGNSASCTQNITVQDTQAPSISCPPLVTVECVADIPAANPASVTASDGCDPSPTVIHLSDVSDGQSCPETITRTYQATDACGNSATCTQTIVVNDTTLPTITGCPTTLTVECDADVPAANTGLVTATDNCDLSVDIAFAGDTDDGLTCPRTITRAYTATDDCGNVAWCYQTIIVDDTTPPSVTCPTGVTVNCLADVPPPSVGLVSAIDNCTANPTIEFVGDATGGTCPIVITRTYKATDDCGNEGFCTQTITVDDQTPPTITCPNDVTVDCLADVPPVNTGLVTAFDNCGGSPTVTWVSDNPVGSCPTVITRVYQAQDACGNVATCTQTITVDDQTPPVLTCPGDVTVACMADLPPVNTGAVTATDNCDASPVIIFVSDVDDGQSCPKTITRTYQATDACGNSATCTQTITVHDLAAPVVTCPPAVAVECLADVPAVNTGAVSAVDNCDPSPVIAFVSDSDDGQTCPKTITRTYSATDACGNVGTCTQIITVDDTTPPVISCPADLTIFCDEPSDPGYTGTATATDNCSAVGAIVITYADAAGSGVLTRTFTATDECGNQASCIQTITVGGDLVPPVVTCPADITVGCLEDVPEPTPLSLIVVDNCDPMPVVTFVTDDVSGSTCPITITRSYRASDASGNNVVCQQIITVDDQTPPVLSGCPADATVECGNIPAPAAVTATDNCSGVTINFVENEVAGSCPQQKTLTRTWTATDACGNEASCSQTITVVDSTPPVVTSCPADVTVECLGDVPAQNTALVTATDNCDPAPTVSWVSDVSDGQTCPETIVRTYQVVDACGNSATCVQTITVHDQTPPVLSGCKADIWIECNNVPAPANVTATDNCSGVTIDFQETNLNSGCAQNYTLERVWTATDACGNTAQCVRLVIVQDTHAPSITCPDDQVVACMSEIPAPNTSLVTVSDLCDPDPLVEFIGDVQSGGGCPMTVTRTYRVTDACLNTAECVQVFTVNDDVLPEITCPDPVTVECMGDVPDPNPLLVTVFDNCDPNPTVIWVSDTPVGTCPTVITRVYQATDDCGNSATCTQIITVDDQTPPQLVGCPQNVTVGCGEVPAPASVTATDNCPGVTLDFAEVTDPGSCEANYTVTRTWTATDACGNSGQCVQVITVQDDTPPTVTCPAGVTVNCFADVPTPDPGLVTAEDLCDADPVVTHVGDVVSGTGCPMTIERTYRAVDDCGNEATCVQIITVDDQEPPLLVGCPADVTVDCGVTVPVANVTASDNCDGNLVVEFAEVLTPGNCDYAYTLTRTWSTADVCGNQVSCQQIITVTDQEGPVVTCPAGATYECWEEVPAPDVLLVTAEDVCDPAPLVEFDNDNLVATGSCPTELHRTYRATDACGNVSTCTQVFILDDQTPPVFTNFPDDQSEVQCVPTELCLPVDATDNCNGMVSFTVADGPGAISAGQWCYTATGTASFDVTIQAIDTCGNTASDVFHVDIEINSPPQFTNCPGDATVHWGETFSIDLDADDADLDQTLVFSLCEGAPEGVVLNTETGLLQWPTTADDICDPTICVIVTDDCGIADTCEFNVCVTNDAPVISCPGNATICHGNSFATEVSAVDPDGGPFLFYYLQSGPDGLTVDANTGAVSWPDPEPGAWDICVLATDSAAVCDPCSPNNADTCCFTLNVVALDLVIEKVHGAIQGQFAHVSIDFMHEGANWPIAGYDFLIQYDASALVFFQADPGEFFTDCAWEYFTYRFGPNGNCGAGACPSGVVRIVALSETTGGNLANHPDCFTNDGIPNPGPGSTTSTELADLTFFVTDDRTFECQYVPIRFVWYDCGDNGLSNTTGDTLYISNRVFDYAGEAGSPLAPQWHEVTGLDMSFPTMTGAPVPDCDLSDKFALIRCANFYNGGVDIICADSIDAPADVNLNGIAYEIADAVMFTNYFIEGLTAFPQHPDYGAAGSIAATDTNRDGIPLSVADLVYLIRVIIGDAQPYHKESPITPVNATFSFDDGTLSVPTDTRFGGAAVVIDGYVEPVMLADGMAMSYSYDGSVTRIVVTPHLDGSSHGFSGSFMTGLFGDLVMLELATDEGVPVLAKNVPNDYRLNQNYPNPFNPTTTIEFSLPEVADYRLTIYNIQGQVVGTHQGRAESAGIYHYEWNAADHASGVYLYRLDTDHFTQTRKMLLLK